MSNVITLDLGKTEVYTFGDGKVTIESDKPLTVGCNFILFRIYKIRFDESFRLLL